MAELLGIPEDAEWGVPVEVQKPGEACGVFGVYDTRDGDSLVFLAHDAALAQQHRGQETAGISVSNGEDITRAVGAGRVDHVFYDPERLTKLGSGRIATSHVRYGTIGSADPESAAQPILRQGFSFAHNGHWPDFVFSEMGFDVRAKTDSEMAAQFIDESRRELEPMEDTLVRVLPEISNGAFSLVISTEDQLFAIRDPKGFRPLILGRNHHGYAVASETIALEQTGFEVQRELDVGEMLVIDEKGTRRVFPFDQGECESRLCSFEKGYFSAPASRLGGLAMNAYRRNLGQALAEQDAETYPDLEIDSVIGVLDSGTPAAIGYAEASGIPFAQGMQKNRFLGRVFIDPNAAERESKVRKKLTMLPDDVRDKRLLVVDDSIIRGDTTRGIVKMLWDSGAREVHVRSSMPQYVAGCHMGMDTSKDEDVLLAKIYKGDINSMAEHINATSLDFLSLERMEAVFAMGSSAVGMCTACMTGEYPIDIRR